MKYLIMKQIKNRLKQESLSAPFFVKTKKIRIWENGKSECHTFNINPKEYRNWDSILKHITETIHPSFGAVHRIIEWGSKKEIWDFQELDYKQKYIVLGLFDGLKEPPKGYRITLDKQEDEKEATEKSPFYSGAGRVTHNWEFLKETERKKYTVIYVAINGKEVVPQKAVFKESEIRDASLIRSYCSKILGIPDGIQRFCTIYGKVVEEPTDFQHGYLYVAVPFRENFVQMDYMGLFPTKCKYRKPKPKKVNGKCSPSRLSHLSRKSCTNPRNDPFKMCDDMFCEQDICPDEDEIPSLVIRGFSSSRFRTKPNLRKLRQNPPQKTILSIKKRKAADHKPKTKKQPAKIKMDDGLECYESEKELSSTYYSRSEENYRLFRATTCSFPITSNSATGSQNGYRFDTLRKSSFPTVKINLESDTIIQANEDGSICNQLSSNRLQCLKTDFELDNLDKVIGQLNKKTNKKYNSIDQLPDEEYYKERNDKCYNNNYIYGTENNKDADSYEGKSHFQENYRLDTDQQSVIRKSQVDNQYENQENKEWNENEETNPKIGCQYMKNYIEEIAEVEESQEEEKEEERIEEKKEEDNEKEKDNCKDSKEQKYLHNQNQETKQKGSCYHGSYERLETEADNQAINYLTKDLEHEGLDNNKNATTQKIDVNEGKDKAIGQLNQKINKKYDSMENLPDEEYHKERNDKCYNNNYVYGTDHNKKADSYEGKTHFQENYRLDTDQQSVIQKSQVANQYENQENKECNNYEETNPKVGCQLMKNHIEEIAEVEERQEDKKEEEKENCKDSKDQKFIHNQNKENNQKGSCYRGSYEHFETEADYQAMNYLTKYLEREGLDNTTQKINVCKGKDQQSLERKFEIHNQSLEQNNLEENLYEKTIKEDITNVDAKIENNKKIGLVQHQDSDEINEHQLEDEKNIKVYYEQIDYKENCNYPVYTPDYGSQEELRNQDEHYEQSYFKDTDHDRPAFELKKNQEMLNIILKQPYEKEFPEQQNYKSENSEKNNYEQEYYEQILNELETHPICEECANEIVHNQCFRESYYKNNFANNSIEQNMAASKETYQHQCNRDYELINQDYLHVCAFPLYGQKVQEQHNYYEQDQSNRQPLSQEYMNGTSYNPPSQFHDNYEMRSEQEKNYEQDHYDRNIESLYQEYSNEIPSNYDQQNVHQLRYNNKKYGQIHCYAPQVKSGNQETFNRQYCSQCFKERDRQTFKNHKYEPTYKQTLYDHNQNENYEQKFYTPEQYWLKPCKQYNDHLKERSIEQQYLVRQSYDQEFQRQHFANRSCEKNMQLKIKPISQQLSNERRIQEKQAEITYKRASNAKQNITNKQCEQGHSYTQTFCEQKTKETNHEITSRTISAQVIESLLQQKMKESKPFDQQLQNTDLEAKSTITLNAIRYDKVVKTSKDAFELTQNEQIDKQGDGESKHKIRDSRPKQIDDQVKIYGERNKEVKPQRVVNSNFSNGSPPALSLSDQINMADSSEAISYPARISRKHNPHWELEKLYESSFYHSTKTMSPSKHYKDGSNINVKRESLSFKNGFSDMYRNIICKPIRWQGRAPCKQPKKTLSQSIVDVTESIKVYEGKLADIDKEIKTDPHTEKFLSKPSLNEGRSKRGSRSSSLSSSAKSGMWEN